MSRKDKRKFAVLAVFFIIAAMIFAVADEVHIHLIVGLIFSVLLAVHTIKRNKQLQRCPSHLKWVDIICIVSLIIMVVSGFFIPILKQSDFPLLLHKLSSAIMILGIIVHHGQHCPKKRK